MLVLRAVTMITILQIVNSIGVKLYIGDASTNGGVYFGVAVDKPTTIIQHIIGFTGSFTLEVGYLEGNLTHSLCVPTLGGCGSIRTNLSTTIVEYGKTKRSIVGGISTGDRKRFIAKTIAKGNSNN